MDVLLLMFILVVAVAAMFLYVMRKINELHLSMNSRLDQLLQKTDSLARAEGFKAGQDFDRAQKT